MKFPIGCAAAAAAIGFLTSSSGCMSRTQRALPAVAPMAKMAGTPSGLAPLSQVTEGFDPGAVMLTLDAPSLAEVKALVAQADYPNAVRLLDTALLASPPPDVVEVVRWRYQLARLRALAGDYAGAAHDFDEVTQAGGPLTPYSQYGAAQALIRIGHIDEGLVRARAVREDAAIYSLARLLVAEGLEQKRAYAGALEIWSEYLAESRHPPRWIEVAMHMADALLQGSPDAARAERAALLARRIVVEVPTSNGAVSRALDMERRALALVPEAKAIRLVVARGKRGTVLPSDYARALSCPDQLTRAGAFLEAQKYDEAQKALEELAIVLGAKGTATETACRLNVALGAVLAKQKERAKSADTYQAAIARCEPYPDAMVEALYFGGKASASANRCDEALERFGRVEKDFHEHRYADDARLRGAECALEQGDEARYAAMLASMPIDYPEGDMVTEALFRLALRKMVRREWGPSIVLLESAKNFKIKEAPSTAGGRTSYFLARALVSSGDIEGGKRALAEVIRDYPLSYYMLHAYARLAEIDEAGAKAVLGEAMGREPAGRFVIDDDPLFHTAGFARANMTLPAASFPSSASRKTALGAARSGRRRRSTRAPGSPNYRTRFRASGSSTGFRIIRRDAGAKRGRWPFRARSPTWWNAKRSATPFPRRSRTP
jgi:soluble lytic murein transglycosylase